MFASAGSTLKLFVLSLATSVAVSISESGTGLLQQAERIKYRHPSVSSSFLHKSEGKSDCVKGCENYCQNAQARDSAVPYPQCKDECVYNECTKPPSFLQSEKRGEGHMIVSQTRRQDDDPHALAFLQQRDAQAELEKKIQDIEKTSKSEGCKKHCIDFCQESRSCLTTCNEQCEENRA
uniref:Uncharacterized protein n=1 Tax=Chromera velia CCMP2878 TaxID=1169474 RepID=A0A0G4I7H5_9ALVE|eukprot:Cvel_11636.t1-p1 / transcript=Cvel_11636.t1 / gene=Cvel_11636 / organism=Chromera_velia_CCMP2878 / gene_product=hypothetical protein / transcript_product=hypothetical protein / location=Cvel_scaffold737:11598-12131(+) / protein_length=178 / sequence_SO=supercontig / SO=protein_coding / is_pseudo=false